MTTDLGPEFGPDAYLSHRASCTCPDCRAAAAAPDTFAAKSAQYDRDIIAKARSIAAAKNLPELRDAIIDAYPTHALALSNTPDAQVWVYASGVMAEVIRELANLAEREINRATMMAEANIGLRADNDRLSADA